MTDEIAEEARAIGAILSALKPLDDNARELVLDFVLKRLDIRLSTGAKAPFAPQGPNELPDPDTSTFVGEDLSEESAEPNQLVDIRSFAKSRNAQTVNERVAIIAYYLAHVATGDERRDYITASDIKKYFIQAGLPLPTSPERITLSNAKNAGYFDAKDRGQYSLNAVGYNLVAHKLAGGAGAATESRKPKRPRKAKKAAKKSTKSTKKKVSK